jgi:integrase
MAEEKFELFGGKLHFFQYPSSPYWYVGFHYRGKYVRKTTKEIDKSAAIAFGERWWHLKQAEILTLGAPQVGFCPTVRDYSKRALAGLQARAERGERSSAYVKNVRQITNTTVLPFFGKYALDKIDVVLWNAFVDEKMSGGKQLSRGSIHQAKNALRLILNTAYRNGVIKALPQLKDNASGPKVQQPRTWFDSSEYTKLFNTMRAHQKTLVGTRWVEDADELYDYVQFNCNAGMRVGEAMNIRFCDLSIHSETDDKGETREFLLIKNIKGKRGTGECRTMDGAVSAYRRILKRRGIENPSKSEEPLFLAYHRDMFRAVLEKADLRYTKDRPPRKRDLTVCRHTYISFRLLNGATAFDVANNCRTSTQMIHDHYAKWLSPRQSKSLNRKA